MTRTPSESSSLSRPTSSARTATCRHQTSHTSPPPTVSFPVSPAAWASSLAALPLRGSVETKSGQGQWGSDPRSKAKAAQVCPRETERDRDQPATGEGTAL